MSLMAFANLFSTKIKIADKTTLKKSDDDFYEYMRNLYKEKGAVWDEVNIFGIRDTADMDKGIWNDWIGIIANGKIKIYKGTTDPSTKWTKNHFKGTDGVAHLCLGFYKDAYVVGLHKGKEALVQWGGPVKIWRDVNKNYEKDNTDVIEEGYFGINIHRGHEKNKIGYDSAGCQVPYKVKDLLELLSIVKSSNKYKKNKKAKFGYLLLSKSEIPEVYLS